MRSTGWCWFDLLVHIFGEMGSTKTYHLCTWTRNRRFQQCRFMMVYESWAWAFEDVRNARLAFTWHLLLGYLRCSWHLLSAGMFCWGYNRWISLAWTSCDILHYFNCIISHSNLDLTHNASQCRIWHAFNLNQSFLPRGTFWTSNHCRPLRVVSFLQMAGDVCWKPAFWNIQKSSLFVIMWIFIRDTCWLGSLNFGVLEDKFWELGNTSPEKVSCRLRRRWLPFASHNLDC